MQLNNEEKDESLTALINKKQEQKSVVIIYEEAEPSGEWYHAAFHIFCVMCGVGVLGLPWTFSNLGLTWGIILLVVSGAMSGYTCCLLAAVQEQEGHRLTRYLDLVAHFLGKKWSYIIIIPFQLMALVGISIVYTIVSSQLLQHTFEIFDLELDLVYFSIAFGILQVFLSQFPGLQSMSHISLIGCAVALLYCSIAIIMSILHGINDGFVTHSPERKTYSLSELTGITSSIGTLYSAFAGQNLIPEIHAIVRQTDGSSVRPMLHAILFSYILCALLYLVVASTGYLSYGVNVPENIMLVFSEPTWVIVLANIAIITHLVAAYQVVVQVVFSALESCICKKNKNWLTKLFLRSSCVICISMIAILFPYFGNLLGLVGAIIMGVTGVVMPNVLWILNGRMTKWKWVINVPLIFVGVIASLLCFVGSVTGIVLKTIDKYF